VADGKLQHGREFVMVNKTARRPFAGGADGIRVDVEATCGPAAAWLVLGFDGVHVFAPDGKQIGLIKLPRSAQAHLLCARQTKSLVS